MTKERLAQESKCFFAFLERAKIVYIENETILLPLIYAKKGHYKRQ